MTGWAPHSARNPQYSLITQHSLRNPFNIPKQRLSSLFSILKKWKDPYPLNWEIPILPLLPSRNKEVPGDNIEAGDDRSCSRPTAGLSTRRDQSRRHYLRLPVREYQKLSAAAAIASNKKILFYFNNWQGRTIPQKGWHTIQSMTPNEAGMLHQSVLPKLTDDNENIDLVMSNVYTGWFSLFFTCQVRWGGGAVS